MVLDAWASPCSLWGSGNREAALEYKEVTLIAAVMMGAISGAGGCRTRFGDILLAEAPGGVTCSTLLADGGHHRVHLFPLVVPSRHEARRKRLPHRWAALPVLCFAPRRCLGGIGVFRRRMMQWNQACMAHRATTRASGANRHSSAPPLRLFVILREARMSHHFDTPTAREDPRINVCDFYLFRGRPGLTVMAMTVNPNAGQSGSGYVPRGRPVRVPLRSRWRRARGALPSRCALARSLTAMTKIMLTRKALKCGMRRDASAASGADGELIAAGYTGRVVNAGAASRLSLASLPISSPATRRP